MFVGSMLVTVVVLFSVYSMDFDTCRDTKNCDLGTQEIINKITPITGALGVGLLTLGGVLLLVASTKGKEQHHDQTGAR